MRKDEVAGLKGVRHTSEKKRKETTCAEGRGGRIERSSAHVREEKKRKRRVRKDEVAGSRGDWHTSEKKRKETTCAEGRGSR